MTISPRSVQLRLRWRDIARPTGTTGQGATPNEIFYTGEGYVGMTADQAFQVKVRVYPAGGEA